MNGPIRIFHVAASSQWAGGERFLIQMADNLDRHVFPMAVVLPEHGPLEEELRRRHVPFEIIPLSPLGSPVPLRRMKNLFREWKPDIVQGHGARANVYTRLAAGPIPCVSTIHNALSDYPVSPPRKWVYKTIDRLTAKRSAAIVCVAEKLRQEFLRRCPTLWERTHVIPNGVDLEVFNPPRIDRNLARRTLGLEDLWTILLMGRMTPQKGHAFFLEALINLKQILPPYRVLFAGDGPLRSALERKVDQLGLRENVVFLGVRHDVPELLAAADVVVMPSLSEGFPYVLLEAMAMEKIVVASAVNGVTELMRSGNEGYLIPPERVDKIEEFLMKSLWDKEESRNRAQAGRHRVQQDFDCQKTLLRWQELYRELSGDLLIK